MRQIYLSLEKQNLHLSVLQSTLPDLRKSMRIVWLGFISRILQSIILLCRARITVIISSTSLTVNGTVDSRVDSDISDRHSNAIGHSWQQSVEGLLCEKVRHPGEEHPCIHAQIWSKADGASQHCSYLRNPWARSSRYHCFFCACNRCCVSFHEVAASVVEPQIKKPKDQPKKFFKISIYTGLMARQMV